MEQHRTDPACASCHRRMDPLGFGLENFDAIGGLADARRRASRSIRRAGCRAGRLSGPGRAQGRAPSRRDAFARCLAEKMLTYALGRGLDEPTDEPSTGSSPALARNDYRFSALVLAVVESEPFLEPAESTEGIR